VPDDSQPSSTQRELHSLRVDYRRGELLETDVLPDAIEQFSVWFTEAKAAGLREPNAMTLATADATGAPSARIVLLKDFDPRGFTFYTNYESRKGQELAANPRASLVFFWDQIERQVRIDGMVEKVSREESQAYFDIRPRNARVGAWASQQSETLASREELESREKQLDTQFRAQFGDAVPLPDHWGGYRVIPTAIEFWQGRPSRLHDRLRYTRIEGAWKIERLSP
jgi:pyridoxamine 5'-phosphate oxidase